VVRLVLRPSRDTAWVGFTRLLRYSNFQKYQETPRFGSIKLDSLSSETETARDIADVCGYLPSCFCDQTAMAHKLADETWATILELILDVHDDDFISFETHTGPFSHRDHSNADVLLVCKRWLRIATPLAFHTCIIRSTAQSQALAKALKKSPESGVLVKRLRLEGCYGASVPNILEKATRLEDLAITLPISSKDNGKPMFAVLNTLQPRRLIICNSPNMYNAQIIFAVDKLKDFIRECDSLVCEYDVIV